MNEIQTAGPVTSPVVDAVTVKMPAPITTATPNTARSRQVSSLRSRVSGSSVSAIDCSIDLMRHRLAIPTQPFVSIGPHSTGYSTVMPRSKEPRGVHAVVIGGSIAGLCAARVLSDSYARVTVYERDGAPGPAPAHVDGPRGDRVREPLSRSAEGHGVRGCSDAGEPAGLHSLGRRGPRPRDGPHPARRVHRLCAQPPAPGVAAAQTGPGDRQRRDCAALGHRAAVRPNPTAGG